MDRRWIKPNSTGIGGCIRKDSLVEVQCEWRGTLRQTPDQETPDKKVRRSVARRVKSAGVKFKRSLQQVKSGEATHVAIVIDFISS